MSGIVVKTLAALLAVAGTVTLGLGLAAPAANEPPATPTVTRAEPVATKGNQAGDPLPSGAVARLGSIRFRTGVFPKQIAISPDGRRLASAAAFNTAYLTVWDAPTGRPLRETEFPYHGLELVRWLADGRGFAVLKIGRTDYAVWDFTSPTAAPPLAGDPSDVSTSTIGTFSACDISPDGRWLAASEIMGGHFLGDGGKLHVWPLRPGKVRSVNPRLTIEKSDGFIALRFTPDSSRLIGVTQHRGAPRNAPGPLEPGDVSNIAKVSVWRVPGGKELLSFDVPASGFVPGFAISSTPLAVGPDGRTLFTSTKDGHVKAFDLATGKERFGFSAFSGPTEDWPGPLVTELRLTADGKALLAVERSGPFAAFAADTGKELWRASGNRNRIYGLAPFPDGKRFAACHGDASIGLYDMATGKPLAGVVGHRGRVRAVAFADGGRTVLTAGDDGTLRRWSATTGRELGQTPIADGKGFYPLSLSPDGRTALGHGQHLTPDGKWSLGLIDTATRHLKARLPLNAQRMMGPIIRGQSPFAWLPDCSAIVSDGGDSATRFGPDGQEVRKYSTAQPGRQSAGREVTAVAVSPDGRTVVLAGTARRGSIERFGWVMVFDANGGRRLREWQTATPINAAAYTPDGKLVLLAGEVGQPPRPVGQPPIVLNLAEAVLLFDPARVDRLSVGVGGRRVADRQAVRRDGGGPFHHAVRVGDRLDPSAVPRAPEPNRAVGLHARWGETGVRERRRDWAGVGRDAAWIAAGGFAGAGKAASG